MRGLVAAAVAVAATAELECPPELDAAFGEDGTAACKFPPEAEVAARFG